MQIVLRSLPTSSYLVIIIAPYVIGIKKDNIWGDILINIATGYLSW
jgi:hypothetical protein